MTALATVLSVILLVTSTARMNAEPVVFTVDGPCSVTFSPAGGITDAIVELIRGAKTSVRVLAYNFTSDEIGDALIEASRRGVDVQIILDRSAVKERNSLLPRMLSAGIPTWIDRRHHIAHNKVIIVDGAWIETGSFNYTASAEKSNGENAIICPSVSGAAIYTENFERHKGHSKPANPPSEEEPES